MQYKEFLPVCLCVSVCLCVCVRTHVHAHVRTDIGLRWDPLLEWGLVGLARLDSYCAPVILILLSEPPQHWSYESMSPCLGFYRATGHRNLTLLLTYMESPLLAELSPQFLPAYFLILF